MKKLILNCILCLLILGANTSKAQMPDGSYAPDFTATDINGNSWHLYDLLDQGKTVVLDISAAWCSPCWRYHVAPFLNSVYSTYGPSGTNEMMVFFIEGEATNTINQINGITTANTYAGFTQGNWVTGTLYPIIDNATIANNFQISYFPTLYVICPDRMTRLMQQSFNTSGTATGPTAAQLYAARNLCSFSTPDVDAGLTNSFEALNGHTLASCAPVSLGYRLANYSTSPLTSATITASVNGVSQQTYNWTGSLNTYQSVPLSFTGITPTAVGNNAVIFTVSNPNGTTDANAANNTNSGTFTGFNPVGGAPVVEAYTSSIFPPSGWTILNGGSTYTWTRSTAGLNGAGSAKLDFYNADNHDVDDLVFPPMDLTGQPDATLTFDIANCRYPFSTTSLSNDNMRVKVSTNCGSSWATIYNKTGAALATTDTTSGAFTPTSPSQWRHETLSLTAYLGQSDVIVKFEGTSNNGNNCYIDNVNVTFTTGIPALNVSASGINVYPNPASDLAHVDFNLERKSDVTIEVMDKAVGQLVYRYDESAMTAGDHTVDINTATMAKGVYVVSIRTSQGTSMKKLVVE